MNTDLRKKQKDGFEKDFFKLMNNAVFGKTTENVRKQILNLLQQKEGITQYQNQITILQSFSQKNLLAIKMRKTEILMNKPFYLGL